MKREACPVLLMIAVALVASGPAAEAGVNKSLVIGLDGVRSDGLVAADTPNIDRLIDGAFGGGSYHGAWAFYAQTIQDAVTSSGPNHVSIMTGVTAAKHGVTTNGNVASGNYATYPHYLTTLETNNSSLNTAYLVTWSTDLLIPSGADYIKGADDAGNAARVAGMISGTFSDPSGDNGTSWASGTNPDAIFLFLDGPDGAGHSYGFSPAVPQYRAAIQQADAQVGQLLTAIENRPTFAGENWQIVIVSDHGGTGTAHGTYVPACETIPFLVASKSVQQGQLSGTPQNFDTAATAVKHVLGAGGVPSNYDGQARGASVQPKAASLAEGPVTALRFENNYNDVSGRDHHASIGANSDYNPILHAGGGKFGGYVEINDFGGGTSQSSYLTLGRPADLNFGTATSLTITLWCRFQGDQSGDPVLIGNKNWASGYNAGTLLVANKGTSSGNNLGLNVADTSGSKRRDISPIQYTANQWWFMAATLDRTGSVTLYAGQPDGTLWILSDFLSGVGDITSLLPWNIGQDGTGNYPHNLDGDVDELGIWNRVLSLDELRELYNNGTGRSLAEALTGSLLPGDANRDALVDSQDFTFLKANFGLSGYWDKGDFNMDGIVDSQDFTILKANFGAHAGMGTVPEPASAALLATGAAGMLIRRMRPASRSRRAPHDAP